MADHQGIFGEPSKEDFFEEDKGREIPKKCPLCGSEEILTQELPDGRIEVICLDLDCSFTKLIEPRKDKETKTQNVNAEEDFAERIQKIPLAQLETMRDKLKESIETLKGKSKRIARRQLAIITSELEHRKKSTSNISKEQTSQPTPQNSSKMPPQFQTPEAIAKRLEAIREYHNKRKNKTLKKAMTTSSRWLHTLLTTLIHDAHRHEQAAQNYAKVPEFFTLHIEHSARAFELNRIIDLLTSYAELIESTDEIKEKSA